MNLFEQKRSPEVDAPTQPAMEPTPKAKAAIRTRKSPQDVMDFLQSIAKEIKNKEPKHLSVVDRIEDFIRDHGDRHPETTFTKKAT